MIKDIASYQSMTDIFLARMRCSKAPSALSALSWLEDNDDSILSEAERLNFILPVIKWCAEHSDMPAVLRDELWLYYKSYLDGTLDKDYKDYSGEDDEGHDLEEDKTLVFQDLKAAYKLVYGTEELVD